LKNKLIQLITNRGFYILLTLVIGIVGVSGYMANLKSKRMQETALFALSEPAHPPVAIKAEPPAVSSIIESEMPLNAQLPATAVASVQTQWEEDMRLMLPLQGELGMGYSADELIYSKTMHDWRIHPGIDIRADAGTPVKAAASGIVTKAYADDLMGFTVEILHEGGFETVYSNLQTGQLIEENDEVKKGDVIGGVGTTALREINEPPHLHFEVKKDGEYVNPFDYIF